MCTMAHMHTVRGFRQTLELLRVLLGSGRGGTLGSFANLCQFRSRTTAPNQNEVNYRKDVAAEWSRASAGPLLCFSMSVL